MGGDQDKFFQTRIPEALKKRFKAACGVGRTSKMSDVCRDFVEGYVEYTEAHGEQPASVKALFKKGKK